VISGEYDSFPIGVLSLKRAAVMEIEIDVGKERASYGPHRDDDFRLDAGEK